MDRAIAEFGLTESHRGAGYLLPDGRMLDFSQSAEGGDPDQRSLDHRAVERLYDDVSRHAAMLRFMARGAARLKVSAGFVGVDYVVPMTNDQVRQICRALAADRGATLALDRRDASGEVVMAVERAFARSLDVHVLLAELASVDEAAPEPPPSRGR
jgi:hypothetical protein